MKQLRNALRIAFYSLIAALILIEATSAQKTNWSPHTPFDFSDRYYSLNGVDPDALIDRRDGGADQRSVLDYSFDRIHREVRITQTFSGYDSDGKIIFWNHYADLHGDSLRLTEKASSEAASIAFRNPLYIFPSSLRPGEFRQSPIVTTDVDENPLGLSLVILIEYTDYARSRQGRIDLRDKLGERAPSADGDPMILTADEVKTLVRAGLITERIRADRSTSHIVARPIVDPRFRAIAPDAFLVSTIGSDGSPLEAERSFVDEFNCLRRTGDYCD